MGASVAVFMGTSVCRKITGNRRLKISGAEAQWAGCSWPVVVFRVGDVDERVFGFSSLWQIIFGSFSEVALVIRNFRADGDLILGSQVSGLESDT